MMGGQGLTHTGGRVLGARLPAFMAAGWLPEFSADSPLIDAHARTIDARRHAARLAEDALVGLRESFAAEDRAQAAALRAAVESGGPAVAVATTPAEVRAVRLDVAGEQFAVQVEALLQSVLEVTEDLRHGAARDELDALIAAGEGVSSMDQNVGRLRQDAQRARGLLLSRLEPALNLQLDVAEVRRLLTPLATPSRREAV